MTMLDMAIDPFKGKKFERRSQSTLDIDPKDDLVDRVLMDFNKDPKLGHTDNLPILTPYQIQTIFQKFIGKKMEFDSSHLMNRLMQTSFNNGYNGFILDTGDFPFDNLCQYLEGTSKRKMQVRVLGSAGIFFGYQSKYMDTRIEGSAGINLYENVEHCSIRIGHDIGKACAHNAFNSYIEINGSVQTPFGIMARSCTFELNSLRDDPFLESNTNLYPRSCAFLTRNRDTAQQLEREFKLGNCRYGNSVQLI